MGELHIPIIDEDKLDDIITALQALAAPSGTDVAISPTGMHIVTEDDVQGAISELDSAVDSVNASLTHKSVEHTMTVQIQPNANASVDVDISSAPSTIHIIEGWKASSGGAGQVVFSNIYFTDNNTITCRLLNLGANPTTTAMKLTIDYK